MPKYRIEQNLNRQESMDGAKPVGVEYADTLSEAKKIMQKLHAKGMYYAAVFKNTGPDYGEMLDETDDTV